MNDYCFTFFLPFIFEDKLNTINIINDIQLINYNLLCCWNLGYINSKFYKDLKKKL